MKRLVGGAGAFLLLAGCATPIAHHEYAPTPVETERVRVVVREVHRGKEGGVVTLGLTNLSEVFCTRRRARGSRFFARRVIRPRA